MAHQESGAQLREISAPEYVGTVILQAVVLASLVCLLAMLYSDQQYSSLFLIGTMTYATILWLTASRFGKLDSRFLFLAVSGLYSFTPVVDRAVLGNLDNFNAEHTAFVLLLSISFFATFYVAASGDWIEGIGRRRRDPLAAINLRRLLLILAGAFAIYAWLFHTSIGFFHSFSRGEIYKLDTSAMASMRFILQVGMLIMIAMLRPVWIRLGSRPLRLLVEISRIARGKLPALFVVIVPAAYFAIDLIALGDRRFIVTFGLAAIAVLAPRKIPLTLVAAGFLAIVTLLVFGILRDSPVSEWSSIISRGDLLQPLQPSNLEFSYFSRIAEDILSSKVVEGYPTYADAVVSTLPRLLYPDRPLGFGEWFVKSYYHDYWASGGGYAGNLMIEAFLNWGLAGPAILGAFLGLFFASVVKSGGPVRLGHGLLMFTLVFAMRFDMLTLLKVSGLTAAAAIGWIFICSRNQLLSRSGN